MQLKHKQPATRGKKGNSITTRKRGGGGRARGGGEVVVGEFSGVTLSFLRGVGGERSGKEGGVDGDSGIKQRVVIVALFSDLIGRQRPSFLLTHFLKL